MSKSPLIASSANTWVNCTGQVKLASQFPAIDSGDGASEARLEGRAFHETAQKILESFKTPGMTTVSRFDLVNTVSRDGIVITDEIYDGALEYANDVLKVCNERGTMREMHIEEHIDLSCIYTEQAVDELGNPAFDELGKPVMTPMYGYIDCWFVDIPANTLYVWEGKYGHRGVDAFENWQLITYVAGILEQLQINGFVDQNLNVSLRVAQPRSFRSDGPISEWNCKAADLRSYINIVKSAAEDAHSDRAVCKVGKQCETCPARHACKTLQQAGYGGADYVGNAEGVSLTGNALALELRILKRAESALKARLSGLEEQALAELRNGSVLPGFVAKQGYGRRRWRKDTPIDEVIMMGDLMGIDVRKPVTLDTPAQVEKKGIDESVISMYSETPMTGFKLVEDNGAKARNAFKKQ